MGYGLFVGRFFCSTGFIYMNPLVVVGRLSKMIDHLLGYFEPGRRVKGHAFGGLKIHKVFVFHWLDLVLQYTKNGMDLRFAYFIFL